MSHTSEVVPFKDSYVANIVRFCTRSTFISGLFRVVVSEQEQLPQQGRSNMPRMQTS